MEFIPKFIRRTEDKRAAEKIKNIDWNELFNLLITQGDWNTQALVDLVATLKTYSTTADTIDLINQRITEIGSADMSKDIYDSNSDGVVNKADAVGVDGVTTESIVDGSVTLEKLDRTLAKKINYCYSNMGSLIVQVGGKDQISGSADLNLFGLDGTLGTGYNILKETLNSLLNAAGYVIGSFAIPHRLLNAESLLKTGVNYTISNGDKVFQTQLSTINNATIKPLTNLSTVLTAVDSSYSYDTWIFYLKNNEYLVAVDGFEKKNDACNNMTIYRVTFDGTKLTKKQLYDEGYCELWDGLKMGDYVFFLGENEDTDGISNFEDLVWVVGAEDKVWGYGIDVETPVRSDSYTFASNGSVYYRTYDSEDEDCRIRRIQRNPSSTSGSYSTILSVENASRSDLAINQLSGHWAYMYDDSSSARVYYLLDLLTGNKYPMDANSPLRMSPDAFDTDGEHFYKSGIKYTIDPNTRELIKVATIKNYNLNQISSGYEVPTVDNNVYMIGKEVWTIEYNTCVHAYSLNSLGIAIEPGTYEALPGGSLNRGIVATSHKNAVITPYVYQDGAIVLTNTGPETMSGELYITRNQDCNVPAGETKHIYLKPTIQNATYNAANMIMYFDRDVEDTDTIVLTVNGVEVTPLSASTKTIKYYETTFADTSDIEVIISVTAGSKALQVTQILGGVDNEV